MPIVNVMKEKELKNAYIGEYRVPWSNTVAYFPLKEDAVDIKNNISLTSYGTTNYTTVWWVNSAEFTKSNWLYRTDVAWLPQWDVAKTLSIWIYPKWTKSFWTWIAQFWINSEQAWSICWFGFSPNTCDLLMTRGYSTSNTYTLTQNQWSNAVITYSNSVWTLYVNWIAQVTWNTTSPSWWTKIYVWSNIDGTNNTTTFYGNLSSFIIEDKSRTAQEVSDYYNSTKANYWL